MDRMKRNGHKMGHGKFQGGIRKNFFTVWLFRYWNRGTEGAIASLTLEIFKT